MRNPQLLAKEAADKFAAKSDIGHAFRAVGNTLTGRNVGRAERLQRGTSQRLKRKYRSEDLPTASDRGGFSRDLKQLQERSVNVPKEKAKTYAARGAAVGVAVAGIAKLMKMRAARQAAKQTVQPMKALPAPASTPKLLPATSSAQTLPEGLGK